MAFAFSLRLLFFSLSIIFRKRLAASLVIMTRLLSSLLSIPLSLSLSLFLSSYKMDLVSAIDVAHALLLSFNSPLHELCISLSLSAEMCMNFAELRPVDFSYRSRRQRRRSFQIRRLKRGRRWSREANGKESLGFKTKMASKNLELYLQNQSIMKENQELREKAILLNRENQALLTQLQKFLTNLHGSNRDDSNNSNGSKDH